MTVHKAGSCAPTALCRDRDPLSAGCRCQGVPSLQPPARVPLPPAPPQMARGCSPEPGASTPAAASPATLHGCATAAGKYFIAHLWSAT